MVAVQRTPVGIAQDTAFVAFFVRTSTKEKGIVNARLGGRELEVMSPLSLSLPHSALNESNGASCLPLRC